MFLFEEILRNEHSSAGPKSSRVQIDADRALEIALELRPNTARNVLRHRTATWPTFLPIETSRPSNLPAI